MERALRVALMGCGGLAVLLAIAACSQASSPPERQEKQAGIEEAREKNQEAASAEAKCSDFYGPQDAQAYLDKKATAAEKQKLDANGDGWACNEGKVAWKPEGPTTTIEVDYTVTEVEEYADDPQWNDGPFVARGFEGAHLRVQLEHDYDQQAAYEDIGETYTEYDAMVIAFYKDKKLLDEVYFFRTPEAEQAFAEEIAQNIEEMEK